MLCRSRRCGKLAARPRHVEADNGAPCDARRYPDSLELRACADARELTADSRARNLREGTRQGRGHGADRASHVTVIADSQARGDYIQGAVCARSHRRSRAKRCGEAGGLRTCMSRGKIASHSSTSSPTPRGRRSRRCTWKTSLCSLSSAALASASASSASSAALRRRRNAAASSGRC